MLRIWFYLEGAGTLAAAGYLLTGAGSGSCHPLAARALPHLSACAGIALYEVLRSGRRRASCAPFRDT
jgi:hypothetical protein